MARIATGMLLLNRYYKFWPEIVSRHCRTGQRQWCSQQRLRRRRPTPSVMRQCRWADEVSGPPVDVQAGTPQVRPGRPQCLPPDCVQCTVRRLGLWSRWRTCCRERCVRATASQSKGPTYLYHRPTMITTAVSVPYSLIQITLQRIAHRSRSVAGSASGEGETQ